MPMKLLQAFADAQLPMELSNPEAQPKLRILHDAGHIICSFPPRSTTHPAALSFCIHLVTPLGHKALRYFGPDAPGNKGGASIVDRPGEG